MEWSGSGVTAFCTIAVRFATFTGLKICPRNMFLYVIINTIWRSKRWNSLLEKLQISRFEIQWFEKFMSNNRKASRFSMELEASVVGVNPPWYSRASNHHILRAHDLLTCYSKVRGSLRTGTITLWLFNEYAIPAHPEAMMLPRTQAIDESA